MILIVSKATLDVTFDKESNDGIHCDLDSDFHVALKVMLFLYYVIAINFIKNNIFYSFFHLS